MKQSTSFEMCTTLDFAVRFSSRVYKMHTVGLKCEYKGTISENYIQKCIKLGEIALPKRCILGKIAYKNVFLYVRKITLNLTKLLTIFHEDFKCPWGS